MLALMGLYPLFHGHLKIREDEYEDDYIAYFFKELLARGRHTTAYQNAKSCQAP
jgi:hypothetical protein